MRSNLRRFSNRCVVVLAAVLLLSGSPWAWGTSLIADQYLQGAKTAADAGDKSKAQRLYQSALDEAGQDDPNGQQVAAVASEFAGFCENGGEYTQAETLYRQALKIQEQKLGADHPTTAATLDGLALALRDQGKYAESETLFRQALKIKEQKLGADHPTTAGTLNNLGLVLSYQGKYAESETLYRQALKIEEQKLGADHPTTAKTAAGLAYVLESQGKLDEAIAVLTPAVERGHPAPYVFRNRGWLYLVKGDFPASQADLDRFCGLKADDDYARAWLCLAGASNGHSVEAAKALSAYLESRKPGQAPDWPASILSFLSGKLTEEEFLKAAESKIAKTDNEQKCEAYFYSGMVRLIKGDHTQAVVLFKKCQATNVRNFSEYRGAGAELRRLEGGK